MTVTAALASLNTPRCSTDFNVDTIPRCDVEHLVQLSPTAEFT